MKTTFFLSYLRKFALRLETQSISSNSRCRQQTCSKMRIWNLRSRTQNKLSKIRNWDLVRIHGQGFKIQNSGSKTQTPRSKAQGLKSLKWDSGTNDEILGPGHEARTHDTVPTTLKSRYSIYYPRAKIKI